jgi:hypothetical protein
MVVIEPLLRGLPDLYFETSLARLFGACRMLMELKFQFDVSDGEGDLSKYKIIFLPDDITVDEDLAAKLKDHVRRGGFLISSAFAGLNPARTGFALEEYGVEYLGPEPFNMSFFFPEKSIGSDLTGMPTTIYNPGIAMKEKKGATVLARLHQPYFNHQSWDGFHENLYIPPEKDSGRPALVRSGNIFHFSFPAFSNYFDHAMIEYKLLVRNCIRMVFDRPLIQVENVPSFGQVTVTAQNTRRIVHLLSYVPELRGKQMKVIEEPVVLANILLKLRKDGQKVQRVYLAPSEVPLEFNMEDDYICVTVPEVKGYQMVVFE